MTITEMKDRFAELNPDNTWFGRKEMAFFGTKIKRVLGERAGRIWFITKDTMPDHTSFFNVRSFSATARNKGMRTDGDYSELRTQAEATELYKSLVQELEAAFGETGR